MNSKVIISFTSWKKRIHMCYKVIQSILSNTYLPDIIYLNLSLQEFPNRDKDIPENLSTLQYTEPTFKINWIDGPNTKTMKKIFPILQYLNDDDIIIDCDDDIILPKDFIEQRLIDFKKYGEKYPITSNNIHKYGAYQHDNMYVISACSLFQKKMLNNWEKLLNETVISTYSDDTTYSYLLILNGYLPKPCTEYSVYRNTIGTKTLDLSLSKTDPNSISRQRLTKVCKSYYNVVNPEVVKLTGKSIKDSFGYFCL